MHVTAVQHGRRESAHRELSLTPRVRAVLRAAAIAGVLALGFHVAHGQLGLGGSSLDTFTTDWLYDAIMIGAAASCVARAALIRAERVAWLLLGIGLAFTAAGEVYYTLAFGDTNTPAIPSLDDFFYLMYYPAAYVALGLLVRGRMTRFCASTWLDGGIVAATAAAVIAAITLEPIVGAATRGNAATVATNIAYPVGDLTLLAIVFGVLGLSGWRPGRSWLLLGLGLALSAIADTAYLYQSAAGTYTGGGLLDSLWLASSLATAFAAWQRPARTSPVRLEGARALLVPGAFALIALSVLLYGGFRHVGAVALVLAGTAILLVIARGAWTLRENMQLLEISQRDAATDALTGLGNRRSMNATLARSLAGGTSSPPATVVMFDLDGFKQYNDRFGHVAGDSLLAHVSRRLDTAVAGVGTAFRPGGDEFCVLLPSDRAESEEAISACVAALSASGEGFSIGSSHGSVAIPAEAHTASQALRLADDRMYLCKSVRRGSAGQETHDVPLGVPREHDPELREHVPQVGRLAVVTGL